jgi:hypothetical protein
MQTGQRALACAFTGLVAIATLAACAPAAHKIQPYVIPVSGPTARLLVRPTLAAGTIYGLFVYEEAQTCRNPQRLTSGELGASNQSTTVRAGALTTLSYLGVNRKAVCDVDFSFFPKAGHTYLVTSNQDPVGCSVRLLDASDGGNPHPEASFVKRERVNGVCQPMTAKPHGVASALSRTAADQLDDFKDVLPRQ